MFDKRVKENSVTNMTNSKSQHVITALLSSSGVCFNQIFVVVITVEGKRPLGRPRRRWEDNIKMDLREVGGSGDWMELAQDRDRWRALVNTVMNFRVP